MQGKKSQLTTGKSTIDPFIFWNTIVLSPNTSDMVLNTNQSIKLNYKEKTR